MNYVRSLRDVQERTGKLTDELTRDELLVYLAARRKHLSASTLNTVVCALKYYYREVARRLELVVDIPNPRKPKQLGDLLNADELRLFLGAARSMRHRLVLELLFYLGMRAGEVVLPAHQRFQPGARHSHRPYVQRRHHQSAALWWAP
ncbi:MAG: hypothetical protein H6573_31430 [Lewinellaceae bacterium]|nr:hypothetical protein [Lewinellaceae bacterium]